MEILETKINEKTQELILLITIDGELFEAKIPEQIISKMLSYDAVEVKQLSGNLDV